MDGRFFVPDVPAFDHVEFPVFAPASAHVDKHGFGVEQTRQFVRVFVGHPLPFSFRELFNVLSELFMLVYDNNKAVADRLAWDRCIRVYRGSRAHLPGTVLHKDLLYRTGNIHIHGLVAANPAITNWFFAGRFDPGNTKHVEVLLALGIITPL